MGVFSLVCVCAFISSVSNDSSSSYDSNEENIPESTTTTEGPKLSAELHDDVKKRFNNYTSPSYTLKKPLRWALYRQYKFPINAKLTKAPVLNKVMGSVLTESCKDRDDRIRARQDTLGHALAALGDAINRLKVTPSDGFIEPDVVLALADAAKLVAAAHVDYTKVRRNLIVPLVNKNFTQTLQDSLRDADFLFSRTLNENLKLVEGGKFTLVDPRVECSAGCMVGTKDMTTRRPKTVPIFGCGKAKVYLQGQPRCPSDGVNLSQASVFRSTKGTPKTTKFYLDTVVVKPPTPMEE